ncbi:indolepyruvate oxidoreductase subunit beta [Desulfuromonas sp. AOP6]|uniref:indolepyruvate oxidoreductase subunit beta n=1 Tax=Desulfuromonas sp. AOP6 TaxID=1566351 RepID=UPI00126F8187|nr:indolepyruvate oxidoreductase subunit beta [Desulfuromonas sp. AOP6]BCA78810.1 indolepyruvate oxidoreductase [Desulfuromonas sp. AOP6]
MKDDVRNILLAGVGGQGTLLASELLSEALLLAGYDVKKSEIHGMSQRGGSVTSHVRYGSKVLSPLIHEGQADILFGFELLETYRYLPMLGEDGTIFVNRQRILPAPVAVGTASYPPDLEDKLLRVYPNTHLVDGLALAHQAGHPRTVNTVLLGALSTALEMPPALWHDVIAQKVPPQFQQENLLAFQLGRDGQRSKSPTL